MSPKLRAVIAALIVLAAYAAAAMGQGSVVAHGGGADWELQSHREMVRWMINQAAAGREGDGKVRVVVLGAAPREPDEPDAAADAFRREGAVVEELVITDGNADAPETAAAIESARVVWIRGGNQWRYVNWWKGTATERAIRKVFEAGGVVGGTSAGCAILGEVTYDARNGSLRPEQALADSHHENLTLTDGFLSVVPGVLFDSHFTERGRIGRLPVMMARAKVDFGKDVLGVGVDHETALMIDREGRGRVIGSGTITILAWCDQSDLECPPGRPPRATDLNAVVLPRDAEYDLVHQRVVHLGDAANAISRIFVDWCGGPPSAPGMVLNMWTRDGGVSGRVSQALMTISRGRPSACFILGGGATTELVDGTWDRIGRDGAASPVAAVVLAAGEGAELSELTSKSLAIVDARLHLLPEGWGIRRTSVEVVPPREAPAATTLPSNP